MVVVEGKVDVMFWTFAGGGYQNETSVNKGGGEPKFWLFCENVIIECPLTNTLIMDFGNCMTQ